MKKLLFYFSKSDGVALPSALLAMLTLIIFASAITALTLNNTRQLATQELNMKAHYLARSGIEVAYTALMIDDDVEGVLFNDFKDSGLYASGEVLESELSLPEGTVSIAIQRRPENSGFVTITSDAQLVDGIGSSRVVLEININNTEDLIWRK